MKHFPIILAACILAASCHTNKSKYDAEGNFESVEVTVSAESTGKILSFDISEGDRLTANQKVGSIDSIQLYLTKLQLEKSAQSVTSNRPDINKQIAAIEAQIRKQKTEQERLQRLFRDGAATEKQMDDINAQITVLENQLTAQKSTLQNSVSSLDAQSSSIDMQIAQISDKLAKCSITSPVSGTVLTKYAEAGEFAAMGKPLFKIADLDQVYLRAYLSSARISNIKIGQKVQVFADFGGDETHQYEGTIQWISSKSEFTPKNIQTDRERENLVYAVKISVVNDGFIKLGMYGGIKF